VYPVLESGSVKAKETPFRSAKSLHRRILAHDHVCPVRGLTVNDRNSQNLNARVERALHISAGTNESELDLAVNQHIIDFLVCLALFHFHRHAEPCRDEPHQRLIVRERLLGGDHRGDGNLERCRGKRIGASRPRLRSKVNVDRRCGAPVI